MPARIGYGAAGAALGLALAALAAAAGFAANGCDAAGALIWGIFIVLFCFPVTLSAMALTTACAVTWRKRAIATLGVLAAGAGATYAIFALAQAVYHFGPGCPVMDL
jgi:hypothetical protein